MNPQSVKQLFTSPPPSDRILMNQKGKQHMFESGDAILQKNFSLIELGSFSDQDNVSQSQKISNKRAQNYKKISQGFSNVIWKKSALRIIYFITKFISFILTNSQKFRFSYINKYMFNFINDQSANYEFYIKNGYIKQKYKLDIYSKIKQQTKIRRFNCLFNQCQKIKIIYPNSAIKIIWDIIVLSLLLLNIVYIPLKVSFQVSFSNNAMLYILFDQLPTYVFILEIILNFFTAYYSHGVLITNQIQIANHYLKKGFLFDFIVLIPFVISKFQISYVEFILLLRIKRVVLIFQNLVETLNLRENFASIIDVSTLIFFFIFLSHLIACSWHFLGIIEQDFGVENTWITRANIEHSEWYTKYITSFYWSCITTLTIGYGDLVPETDSEKIFVILVALISSVVFGYTISNIGQIFSEISESKKKQKDKMTLISRFIRKRGLNKELQTKVKKFFEYYCKTDQDKEKECQDMMGNLTYQLQVEVKKDLYSSLLKKSNFLRRTFSDEFLNSLCIYIKEKQFIPDEIILEQGQISENLYFITKGVTEGVVNVIEKKGKTSLLNHKHQRKINKSKKGDILAERFIITQQNIPYQVRSQNFTKVAYFSIKDFHHLLSLYPQDREKYFQAKHYIEMNNQIQKYFPCPFCFQNHQFQNCSFIQYVPNLKKILLKDEKQTNIRNEENLIRTENKSFKFYSDRKVIQENAVIYSLDQNYFNPDQFDEAFQQKYGVIIPQNETHNDQQSVSEHSLKLQSQKNQSTHVQLNQIQDSLPSPSMKRKSNRGFSKIQLKLPSVEQIPNDKTIQTPKEREKQNQQQSLETFNKYNSIEKQEETQKYCVMNEMKGQYQKIIQEDSLILLDKWNDYQSFFPSYNLSVILDELKNTQLKQYMTQIKLRRMLNSSNRITLKNVDKSRRQRYSIIS